MAKPGSIFISYRRSDSIHEAGRIYDKLAGVFGPAHVFKDVDDIPYGADFVTYLEQAVAQCDVLISLIGKSWLEVTDAQGRRRLDDPHDFVRIEIASALTRDILVLPVLLNGATMPSAGRLPENLQALARRNAAQVRHDPDFHSDMERVIDDLEDYFVSRGLTNAASKRDVKPVPEQNPQRSQRDILLSLAAVISGINGLIGLIDWLAFLRLSSLLASAALITSAVALMRGLRWGWKCAVATQIFTLILCVQASTEFIPPYLISPFADFLLLLAVVLSTLLNLILLTVSRFKLSR
ncbi:MAG: toll/interleukin-1 receptor domain-containing protein [Cyanobacteria bacterium P01_G01_bin.38]